MCVCLAGLKKSDPRRPAQQYVHSAHLFFSRNIFYRRPLLLDSFFLFLSNNICEKMLLYGTPSPWSQIPNRSRSRTSFSSRLPVPRNLRVSGGGPASVHVGGDVGPSPRRASGAQKSYFGQIGRLIVYIYICSSLSFHLSSSSLLIDLCVFTCFPSLVSASLS